MGYEIKQSDSLYYAKLFKLPEALIGEAASHGVAITAVPSGLRVVTHNGVLVKVVPVKGPAIKLAQQGTLGPTSAEAIRYALRLAIEGAIKQSLADPMSAGQKAALTKKLNKAESYMQDTLHANHEDGSTPSEGAWPAGGMPGGTPVGTTGANPSTQNTGTKVKLSDADVLGQPCIGTSPGSTYYLVMRCDGLNIAVRRTNAKFSLRAEGAKLFAFTSILESFGFTMNDGYASVHVGSSELSDAKRMVGALLGSVGPGSVLAWTDPSVAKVSV